MEISITGDALILQKSIRDRIEADAKSFASRFNNKPTRIEVKLEEEFDQVKGHRVRCGLSTSLGDRRQILVRESRKKPEDAIAAAFTAAKRTVRRLAVRRSTAQGLSPAA